MTACGFEQSLACLSCGIADGIPYLYEGQLSNASLSFVASVPVAGTMGDIAKVGKLTEGVVTRIHDSNKKLRFRRNLDTSMLNVTVVIYFEII